MALPRTRYRSLVYNTFDSKEYCSNTLHRNISFLVEDYELQKSIHKSEY